MKCIVVIVDLILEVPAKHEHNRFKPGQDMTVNALVMDITDLIYGSIGQLLLHVAHLVLSLHSLAPLLVPSHLRSLALLLLLSLLSLSQLVSDF